MLLSGEKKNHSCFPSCKYSVLFFPCFWYGVVHSKLVRVSSIIIHPRSIISPPSLRSLEGENWKPAGHRLKLRVNGKSWACLDSLVAVRDRGGIKSEHLGFCLPACLAFPVGIFGVLWHETPAGLCLLALSISSHFLDSTRSSWILIVLSITHQPCLPEPHILWID